MCVVIKCGMTSQMGIIILSFLPDLDSSSSINVFIDIITDGHGPLFPIITILLSSTFKICVITM